MIIILTILLIIAIGFNFYLAGRLNNNRSDADKATEIMENAKDKIESQMRTYEDSTARLLETTRMQYERQIELLQQRLERQGEDLKQRSTLEFSNLAEQFLSLQAERLNAGNREELGSILNPLKENIEDFRKAVNDYYLKENLSREALSGKIDILAKTNSEMSIETRRLSASLRGNASLQGKWGETVLEQLLQKTGLIKDIHFLTQTSRLNGTGIKNEEGKTLRPDIIILLPGNHRIVVDAKTSMTSYFRASELEDAEETEKELKRHALSVKNHIDELSSRQYHKNIEGALEHTLMFIPNDAAYLAALRGDMSLPDYALQRNVVIVAPAHLLSVVQLVSQIWRIENQNRNADNIARLGGLLYDKIASFVADFENIDKNIQASARAYEKCLHHLSSGNTSILRRSEKLRTLGAKTSRKIPDSLLEEGSES